MVDTPPLPPPAIYLSLIPLLLSCPGPCPRPGLPLGSTSSHSAGHLLLLCSSPQQTPQIPPKFSFFCYAKPVWLSVSFPGGPSLALFLQSQWPINQFAFLNKDSWTPKIILFCITQECFSEINNFCSSNNNKNQSNNTSYQPPSWVTVQKSIVIFQPLRWMLNWTRKSFLILILQGHL